MTILPYDRVFSNANQRPLPDQIGPVTLSCPNCAAPVGERVRIVVVSIQAAAKHPALPEMLLACSCGELFVVALWPSGTGLGTAVAR